MTKILLTAVFLLLVVVIIACKPKPPKGENYRSVDVTTARQMLEADKNIVLLDVRTPGEVNAGHIDGALKINVMDSSFASEIDKLDKNKTYMVYCKSGGRSVTASNKMIAKGFTDVINMEGGFTAWSK